jgi:hypothetical protein
VVAIVAQVPDRKDAGGGVITGREFEHGLDQAAAQHGRRVAPGPRGDDYRKLKNQAIRELIEATWIRGQAAEMGIGLRPRKVAKGLAVLKKQAFKNGAQYRRFLKEAHYTRRDLLGRVEIQMLSELIQERVLIGIRGEAAAQKAFNKFVVEFVKRWRARTVCAPGYVTEIYCSNGPAPKGL